MFELIQYEYKVSLFFTLTPSYTNYFSVSKPLLRLHPLNPKPKTLYTSELNSDKILKLFCIQYLNSTT